MISRFAAASTEMPADLLEQPPELPKLNILIAKKYGEKVIPTVPESIVKDWWNHPKYGDEFKLAFMYIKEMIHHCTSW